MNIKFYTEKSTYRTNLSCYRQTRTTLYVTPIVLYTKVDAQCDKLATVVDRAKLTTFATVDVSC